MHLRIEACELPGTECHPGPGAPQGYRDIRVGVQRRNDPRSVLGIVSGDETTATWTLDCAVKVTAEGVDITGPYVQGRPHRRFVYLSWLSEQGPGPMGMFRRAKIRLDDIPQPVLEHAVRGGSIAVQVRLTDDNGNPSCATLGPPAVAWRQDR